MSESTTASPDSTAGDSPASGGGAAPTRRQTALMKRLAKMSEHKDYAKAMEHVPPTEEDLERAGSQVRRGAIMLIVALIVGSRGLSGGGLFWYGLAAVLAVLGVLRLLEGIKRRGEVLSNDLTRRCALVADRRSETTPGWLDGRTVYFFRLEFDDGTNGEFRYPGRGVQDDLLVKGITGVAYLRGDTLIAWKTIKV